MKRVLVTGASGFIGRHCLDPLKAAGYDVHAVSTRPHVDPAACVSWHKADLLEAESLAALMRNVKPTHLLHLAWYAVPGLYQRSLNNFLWVQASLQLLRAFDEVRGVRAVMAGSCAEYDWQSGFCSEHVTPLRPRTTYGNCKHSLQILFDEYIRQTQMTGAWGRIFFLYGPHEPEGRLVASVIRSLLRGQVAPCSEGLQFRDYLHVGDVASGLVALLNSDISGPVNIASSVPISIRELVMQIGQMLNKVQLLRIGARDSNDEEPLVVGDSRRLRRNFNWSPRHDLRSGLRDTIDWWRGALGEVQ